METCAALEAAAEEGDWPMIESLLARLGRLLRDIEASAAAFLRSEAR